MKQKAAPRSCPVKIAENAITKSISFKNNRLTAFEMKVALSLGANK